MALSVALFLAFVPVSLCVMYFLPHAAPDDFDPQDVQGERVQPEERRRRVYVSQSILVVLSYVNRSASSLWTFHNALIHKNKVGTV